MQSAGVCCCCCCCFCCLLFCWSWMVEQFQLLLLLLLFTSDGGRGGHVFAAACRFTLPHSHSPSNCNGWDFLHSRMHVVWQMPKTPLPDILKKNEHKTTNWTYGVKTMNQQRMERDPAMLDSITFVGMAVGDPSSASVGVLWWWFMDPYVESVSCSCCCCLASQKNSVWRAIFVWSWWVCAELCSRREWLLVFLAGQCA